MKIGHTGITWGGEIEQAYKDTSELGYLGFETFAQTIIQWNKKPCGYRSLVNRFLIPTVAAYCYHNWIDVQKAKEDIETAKREADALRDLPGGETLVLQAGPRQEGGLTSDQFHRLADALNNIGQYCLNIGLTTGLHPHTGTAIETREEIDTILNLVDPSLVGFAPDTGQIAKGGSDILEVMRTYRKQITHVHLKDWGGKYERGEDGREIDFTGYANYEPVGNGVLPMPDILEILFDDDFDGWVNVELDGTPRAPRPPREAAAMSRRYLGELLGNRVSWRN